METLKFALVTPVILMIVILKVDVGHSELFLQDDNVGDVLFLRREKRDGLSGPSEFFISVEVNLTDLQAVESLRTFLAKLSFPLFIDERIQLSSTNITTVCSPNSNSSHQCTCEGVYRWSCDQCDKYSHCDDIINDTCGCINEIPPDGSSCRFPNTSNFTPCHRSTTSSPTTTTPNITTTVTEVPSLPTTATTYINTTAITEPTTMVTSLPTEATTDINTTAITESTTLVTTTTPNITTTVTEVPTPSITTTEMTSVTGLSTNTVTTNVINTSTLSTTPGISSPVYKLISLEVRLKDAEALKHLRDFVANMNHFISIPSGGPSITVVDVNITTVCSPTNGSYQCICEGQYRWSCDQCLQYKHCDDITDDTCGCIRNIPSNGSYCLSPQYNDFSSCHSSTTSSPTTSLPTTATTDINTTAITEPTTMVTSVTPIVTSATYTTTKPPLTILRMSVTLDLSFIPPYDNNSSTEHIDLKTRIDVVLTNTYKDISGFEEASVTGFRPGSVIVDYTVATTQFEYNEITGQNEVFERRLVDEIQANVSKSVTMQLISPNPIDTSQSNAYTGRELRLKCQLSVDVGTLTDAEWKHQEIKVQTGTRKKIEVLLNHSILTISNIIPSDSGDYECTLKSKSFNHVQEGRVENIREAPNIRVNRRKNVECKPGQTEPLICCVQSDYTVEWSDLNESTSDTKDDVSYCTQYDYPIHCTQPEERTFTCRVLETEGFNATMTLVLFTDEAKCNDSVYGEGQLNDQANVSCKAGFLGTIEAKCEESGWEPSRDTCVLMEIEYLRISLEDLEEDDLPEFAKNVSATVGKHQTQIVQSPATIDAVVDIVHAMSEASDELNQDVTKDILDTVDVIIGEDSEKSWDFLNADITQNTSSVFLDSMENLSGKLNGTFAIETKRILLNKTPFNSSYDANLNSSAFISIPFSNIMNVFITTITFRTLIYVMPTRVKGKFLLPQNFTGEIIDDETDEHTINAAVVLVKINGTVPNVTLSYTKLNQSLSLNPQCVFWNFTLVNEFGAWDDQGCTVVSNNYTVVCSCDHLTSFSILMSTGVPETIRELLDVITYVGVGISMASLVICIIIEAYVWKELTTHGTGFMRHFSTINIAISLLIANICFIIGASISNNPKENPGGNFTVPIGPCSTATFFMHFFYLAVFFWMLVLGILLLYKVVNVLSHTSKTKTLIIGVSLGYICPLLIAVITVAVTAPNGGYIRKDYACWLNWIQTKAVLALAVPGLSIVFVNIIVVIVVLVKLCRCGAGEPVHSNERNTLLVVLRLVAVLSPLFGLTWGLGVGTMVSATNKGIHIAFAFFNSLQGFFILVFGTLLDSKIREILSKRIPAAKTRSNTTGSTSGGFSSSSGLNIISRLRRRRRREVYHVANPGNSSSGAPTELFINA